MKITDITVDQLRGINGILIVQVHTSEGLVGIAEGGRDLAIFKTYLEDKIKPLLVGMDPIQPRKIW